MPYPHEMPSGPGQRIKQAREARKMSQAQLATAVGQDQSTIAHWERERNFPKPAMLKRLAVTLGVTPEWLLYGTKPESASSPGHTFGVAATTDDGQATDAVSISELELRAMAGNGGEVEVFAGEREMEAVTGRYSFPAAGFRELYGAAPDRVRIVEVIGDSMEPTLRPGQKLMLDIADRFPTPPGIFVVFDGFGMVIKRISIVPHSDPLRVKISSDNKEYDPYERLVEEAHIQGRIIGTWRRL